MFLGCRHVFLHVFCGILFALKPFRDYSLCSVYILPQPAFYFQSVVCILHSVCILLLVHSLQSTVRSLRFTLTVLPNIQALQFASKYRFLAVGIWVTITVSSAKSSKKKWVKHGFLSLIYTLLISLEKYLSTHVTALLNLLAIFPVQASPLRRVSLRRRDGWGEEEKNARGKMGMGSEASAI